jgi:hypothetical protein
MLLNLDSRGFYQKRYGVVNLGTGGYGSKQELIALRRWASLIRRPSFILYLGCENDYEDDVLFESGYRHRHIVADNPIWGQVAGLTQIFTDDLQLGLRLKVLVGLLRRSRIFREAGLDEAEQKRSVAELVSPQLEKFLAYAKASGAMLVVSWAYPGGSYDWLKSWAEIKGVAFADWAPREQSVQAAIPTLPEENHHSTGHHRTWVNRVIAEEFARKLMTSHAAPQ